MKRKVGYAFITSALLLLEAKAGELSEDEIYAARLVAVERKAKAEQSPVPRDTKTYEQREQEWYRAHHEEALRRESPDSRAAREKLEQEAAERAAAEQAWCSQHPVECAKLLAEREQAEAAAREQRRAAEVAREQKRAAEVNAKYEAFMKKAAVDQLAKDGKAVVGMTGEQLEKAWGKPSSIDRSVTERGTTEHWWYSDGRVAWVSNGVVDSLSQSVRPAPEPTPMHRSW